MSVFCDGVPAHIQKPIKNVKAYAEGAEYRLTGTLIGVPITDNPFSPGEQNLAWDAGWTDANGDGLGAGGTIQPCVSGYTRTGPA